MTFPTKMRKKHFNLGINRDFFGSMSNSVGGAKTYDK